MKCWRDGNSLLLNTKEAGRRSENFYDPICFELFGISLLFYPNSVTENKCRMSGSRTLYNFTIENQTLQLHWKAQNSNKRSALEYKKLLQRDLKVTDFQGLETRVTENLAQLVFPSHYTFVN